MKQQLLLGAAVFAALSVFSQKPAMRNVTVNKVDKKAELAAIREASAHESNLSPMVGSGVLLPNLSQRPASPPSTYSWGLLCGSMNTYGMTGSNQKPLQYNPALNAVSFIHRKSASYTVTPSIPTTAESGVIVAEVTTNWGATWDSTAIWSDATQWGRYPQGGIYNPPGNTNIANAYAVGMGEAVDAASFSGAWYASKKLDVFNNTASTATGAQQFYSAINGPYPVNMPKHAWPRNGFNATNDGVIRALGLLGNDIGGAPEIRGYAVVTGTFNGTAFDYKIDSIIPPAVMESDGFTKALQDGQMVWNPAGTVGYVVGIGVMNGATRANRAAQPIIYKMDKTLSSSATWSLMSGLDFNNTFTTVPYHLPRRIVSFPTIDTTELPACNDFDITIDANNNLHIGIVFMSGFSTHPDSLNYYTTFGSVINSTESYRWQHLPGERPYIYDFIGNGVSPWKMVVVDSMSSESPSQTSGRPGYVDNPWDPTGTNSAKLTIDGRLQLGRTPDGQYITFSWAESDTLYTNNYYKYNTLPDVKSRLMAVTSGTDSYVMDIGPELNVTASSLNVKSRATLHYMSATTSSATVFPSTTSTTYTVDVRTPFTVTNSNPYAQLSNNATWFGNTNLSYKFKQAITTPTGVGIPENSAVLEASYIYPNPAQTSAVLAMVLENRSSVDITVFNAVGQVEKVIKADGQIGENQVRIDLTGLSAGIYLVNIKAGAAVTTKKLIIE